LIWLLDTNTCIQYLNGRSSAIRDKLRAATPNEVVLCSIVKTELVYGALRTRDPETAMARLKLFLAPFPSLPFDDSCVETCALIRSKLTASGTPVGPHDLLIAAIAIAHDLTLVTHNTREFSRIGGLRLEDWET